MEIFCLLPLPIQQIIYYDYYLDAWCHENYEVRCAFHRRKFKSSLREMLNGFEYRTLLFIVNSRVLTFIVPVYISWPQKHRFIPNTFANEQKELQAEKYPAGKYAARKHEENYRKFRRGKYTPPPKLGNRACWRHGNISHFYDYDYPRVARMYYRRAEVRAELFYHENGYEKTEFKKR